MRSCAIAAVLFVCLFRPLTQASLLASTGERNSSRDAVERALAYFAEFGTHDRRTILFALRPPPINDAAVKAAVDGLPRTGALNPTGDEINKLTTLKAILAFHKRDAVFVIKIVDAVQARIGLHARSILLVSRPALNILTPGELQAIVAHELGHDFFWNEYGMATRTSDAQGLQELELKCDGVAVLTLVELRLNADTLISGISRMYEFNHSAGRLTDHRNYPTLADRARFIRTLMNSNGILY
jgi:hypothetical protein